MCIYMYKKTCIHTYIYIYIYIHEIGLKIITTAKISNKFSRESPYISNKFSRDSPIFQTFFTSVKGVPVTQMIYQGN